MKNQKAQIAKDILITLLKVGGILSIAVMAPNAFQILKLFNKKGSQYNRYNFKKSFDNLQKRGFFSLKKDRNKTKIILTTKGKNRAKKYYLDDIKIKKPQKWDKKWRIVIFDIPENKRLIRDILRAKLKELEFIKIQKSVFISPYPCQKELELVTKFYNIEKYIIFIIAKDIFLDNTLIKKFSNFTRS